MCSSPLLRLQAFITSALLGRCCGIPLKLSCLQSEPFTTCLLPCLEPLILLLLPPKCSGTSPGAHGDFWKGLLITYVAQASTLRFRVGPHSSVVGNTLHNVSNSACCQLRNAGVQRAEYILFRGEEVILCIWSLARRDLGKEWKDE